MSDPGSTGTESASAPKKKVSPARNAIGLIVLIIMLVFCGFQYAAVLGYNAAVKALDKRTQQEDKDLLGVSEAETLLGKAPDGPGHDVEDSNRKFTMKKYTWHGVIASYTITAYYTQGAGAYLHHFEPEGAKYAPEEVAQAPSVPVAAAPGSRKGRGKTKSQAPPDAPSKAAAASTTVPAKANAAPPAAETSKPAPAPVTDPARAPAPETPKSAPATPSEPAKAPK
jgi:hypothetical protein